MVDKIRRSNGDVGGKVFEVGSTVFYARGRGYIKSIEDIEDIPLKTQKGTPVYIKNVGTVHLGRDLRRGIAEPNGEGEGVGGIIVMRYGENALRVIDGIKKKLEKVKPSLPEGVEIVITYDRSQLIKRSIATLKEKLIEESIVVALVCLVFLWHIRSALVAILTLPIAIILSFLPMYKLGVTLVPVLMVWLIRGKITPEKKNPVNRFLIWAYQPFVKFVLRFRWPTLIIALLIMGATVYPFTKLGKEFMPPLNEGDILFMPTAVPGITVTEALKVLQLQDRMLRQFPEVETVFGKAGHDVGQAHRGNERENQDARHGEHYLDADSDPHRDVDDRLPLDSWHKSFRS